MCGVLILCWCSVCTGVRLETLVSVSCITLNSRTSFKQLLGMWVLAEMWHWFFIWENPFLGWFCTDQQQFATVSELEMYMGFCSLTDIFFVYITCKRKNTESLLVLQARIIYLLQYYRELWDALTNWQMGQGHIERSGTDSIRGLTPSI